MCQLSCVFFAVHWLYIFVLPTRCLRLAYAVAVFSYAGTIFFDLHMRAYAYQLFSDFAYAACVCCSCGLPPTPPTQKKINQHPQNAYEKPTRASEMPTPALHKTYFL